MNIKEKAYELFHTHCQDDTSDDKVVEIMLLFALEMCELQKIECAENAKVEQYNFAIENEVESEFWIADWNYSVNKNSILNTKNVCEN